MSDPARDCDLAPSPTGLRPDSNAARSFALRTGLFGGLLMLYGFSGEPTFVRGAPARVGWATIARTVALTSLAIGAGGGRGAGARVIAQYLNLLLFTYLTINNNKSNSINIYPNKSALFIKE